MKQYLLASALLAGTAFSATAADLPRSKAQAPAIQSLKWAGPYVGVHAGLQMTTAPMALVPGGYDSVFAPGTITEATFSPNNFAVGVFAGYMFQLSGSTYVGPEIDLTAAFGSDTKLTTTSTNPGFEATNKFTQTFTGRLRGRLGYDAGAFMPFIAGGLSVSRIKVQLDLECEGEQYSDKPAKTVTGFNMGAGVDYALTSQIKARVEYIFDYYGSHQLATIKPDWNDRKFNNLRTSTVRTALVFNF